ncbi:distal tail protein Dit [Halobacillus salinus]|uniref:distal tail protein Dit n=1 Tax=Halobacillus salinus TaxID=192814 RepID=UPI0009A6A6E8|nr:distal tail protein Dit [Halobacillus salinus]
MYGFVDFSEVGTQRTSSSIQTIFNSINLDEYLTDESGTFRTLTVSGRSNRKNRIQTVEIPWRDGLLEVEENTMAERTITIQYQVSDQTNKGFIKRCERLNACLDGSGEQLLFTDDESYFFATLESNTLPEEDSNTLIGTLTFTCSNPLKYGKELEANFQGDTLLLSNAGTGNAQPIFEIEVLEDITHIDLVKSLEEDLKFIRIGKPPVMSDTIYEPETLILHDTCSTMNGWTQASELDNGHIGGEMVSEGGRFKPSLFGGAIQPYSWQGPSMKRSIGKSLSDYRVDVMVELVNVDKGTGMIEIYLLDADNNVVAKIGVEDIWRTNDKVQTKFQLGPVGPDRFQYYSEADQNWRWNNYKGILRITSHGHHQDGKRRIEPYFALVRPDGVHDWIRGRFTYIGPSGKFDQAITQVQTAFRIWAPTYDKADMFIDDIKVFELNPPPDEGASYIARAGDKIIIDTGKEEITLNGESIRNKRSFWSEYFDVTPGDNLFHQFPRGALQTKIKYAPTFK